jgi:hypothetical protein
MHGNEAKGTGSWEGEIIDCTCMEIEWNYYTRKK